MTPSARWVTMADVARAASVSKITVSRVLRKPDKVAPATRERVREAIRVLGYIPDEAAGALAKGKNRTVAALLSILDGSIFAPAIDGLTGYLRQNDHELLIASTGYSQQVEAELVPVVLSRHPAGLVLSSTDHTDVVQAMIRRSGVPVVEIWELPDKPLDMAVGFSNFDAGCAMTRLLYDTGRRHIAYIGGGERIRGQMRYQGYAHTLSELGLVEPAHIPDNIQNTSRVERGALGIRWFLEHHPEVDAIFCMNDWIALGAVSEARRLGKSVPADIAVAGLGDFDFTRDRGVGITTIRIPGIEMGATAARLILERNQGVQNQSTVIDLGFDIVRRSSA